ncbi:MAG: SET domain-containing protein-lysine N-methyltransferase [Verrucomicrobiota bacterium JB022]|nr:SET domain-containing protein-lysine N-methyltransferase [Verrucomicrobiota bacterium JB022]
MQSTGGAKTATAPETVVAVNELLELRRSAIHGQGIFARVDIAQGARLVEYVGEKIDKEESNRRGLAQFDKAQQTGEAAVYIFDLDDEWDLDGDVPDNYAKFINHSCEPNAEAVNEDNRLWIFALADIPAGGEIVFDYGYDIEHYLDHPCRCGTPSCVGYIVSRVQWPKLRRILTRTRAAQKRAAAEKAAQKTAKKTKKTSRKGTRKSS